VGNGGHLEEGGFRGGKEERPKIRKGKVGAVREGDWDIKKRKNQTGSREHQKDPHLEKLGRGGAFKVPGFL